MQTDEGHSAISLGNLALGIGPTMDSKYARSNEALDAALLTFLRETNNISVVCTVERKAENPLIECPMALLV